VAIHIFEYTNVDVNPSPAFPQGYRARRPALNVVLTNGNSQVACIALADSGADITSFPISFLSDLGIDSAIGPAGNFASVGSKPHTVFHDIQIEVEAKFRLTLRVGFFSGDWEWGLLGINDFFAHFASVRFNRDNFELETPD
jgi:hypothetical protein